MVDTFDLSTKTSRLAAVRSLLGDAFPNGGKGDFMENAHPKTLGLMDTVDRFMTTEDLVARDEQGARIVIAYLQQKIENVPA